MPMVDIYFILNFYLKLFIKFSHENLRLPNIT